MSGTFEDELKAEIESFRAEVREREEGRERQRREAAEIGLSPGTSSLDAGAIKDLIYHQYENARLRKRIEAMERRIAELEGRNG